MSITEQDIETIQNIVHPIIGKPAWGLYRIYANLKLNFGKPRTLEDFDTVFGEWSLLTRYSAWRLQTTNKIIFASNDPDEKLDQALQRLEGAIITSIDILRPSMITTFSFEDGLIMRLFPVHTEGKFRHWELFTPDHHVLIIGPGSQWRYIRSDVPYTK